eukprot:3568601-Pleurochrysis_carterae.AAC.3
MRGEHCLLRLLGSRWTDASVRRPPDGRIAASHAHHAPTVEQAAAAPTNYYIGQTDASWRREAAKCLTQNVSASGSRALGFAGTRLDCRASFVPLREESPASEFSIVKCDLPLARPPPLCPRPPLRLPAPLFDGKTQGQYESGSPLFQLPHSTINPGLHRMRALHRFFTQTSTFGSSVTSLTVTMQPNVSLKVHGARLSCLVTKHGNTVPLSMRETMSCSNSRGFGVRRTLRAASSRVAHHARCPTQHSRVRAAIWR